MSNETYGLSLTGVLGAIILYALFSAFISGPIILEREVIKSGWHKQCQSTVKAEVIQSHPEPEFVPRIDCKTIFGGFGKGSSGLCELVGPLDIILKQKYEALERAKALNEQRLQAKLQAAGSRCKCPVSLLSERRIDVGLYSATARIVKPQLFKNLNSELMTALRSPHCAHRN